jgi:rhodanese-related sulfurtransferase
VSKRASQVLILLLLALAPAALSALFHPKRPAWTPEALGPGEMLLADVSAWTDAPLWVDARPKSKFDQGHVPGAVLLNEDDWDELMPGLLAVWKPEQSIVVYCDDRLCDSSHAVAKRLRETGIHPVFVLKGGWEAWKAAGK